MTKSPRRSGDSVTCWKVPRRRQFCEKLLENQLGLHILACEIRQDSEGCQRAARMLRAGFEDQEAAPFTDDRLIDDSFLNSLRGYFFHFVFIVKIDCDARCHSPTLCCSRLETLSILVRTTMASFGE